MHSTLGLLSRIDPDTGEATEIDLRDASLPSGDGLVLQGRTLYVVQNFLDQISEVRLDPTSASVEVVDVISSELFRIPTTGPLRFRPLRRQRPIRRRPTALAAGCRGHLGRP